MAGIAGIDRPGQQAPVTQMLQKMAHRGHFGSKIVESNGTTAGAVWPEAQVRPTPPTLRQQAAWDGSRPPLPEPAALGREREPFALATATSDGLFLARDPVGICPLYYGRLDDETLCFASEVKALLELTHDIHEFPPGTYYNTGQGFQVFSTIEPSASLSGDADAIATSLRLRLEQAVCRKVGDQVMGSWLSGGLDSSVMAALARPLVQELHTFAGGTPGAPDLEFARQVSDFLNTEHHEILVTLEDLLAVLPEVIYHLESFDALLVRSSLTNYLVARHAAGYTGAVFSGEGADELFGGYAYLKQLNPGSLPDELVDITRRLHNTALQRVDRSASAHGLVAHVPFLDLDIVQYALRIPSQLKLRRTDGATEKWILRYALVDALPEDVLWRRKAKFWQGAGVGELLAEHAENQLTDADFARERTLLNGWALNTKEELMYYRIFREYFGDLRDLSWMGRTKGAPIH
jgi:asparagine synthase (glutamine-hydrolysing)